MPRIRAIKPEFWSSPHLSELDPLWRLLFIAMWNWADDYGRGTCEPRELMGFAFPHDENMTVGEFRRGLDGVRRAFGIKFYRVGGRSYYMIPSWEKHQKIDKRAKASKYPDPEDGQAFNPLNGQVIEFHAESSENPPESSMGNAESSGAGTGEQGNRGTDKEKTPNGVQKTTTKATTKRGSRIPDGFEPSPETVAKVRDSHPNVDLQAEHDKFVDYFLGALGQKGVKLDWEATWRNWMRRAGENQSQPAQKPTNRGHDPSDWLAPKPMNEPPF